ncbi:MAG: hypothetical protein Q7S83_01595 [bacterium]|nr:hypothetical protein [bacterium]
MTNDAIVLKFKPQPIRDADILAHSFVARMKNRFLYLHPRA